MTEHVIELTPGDVRRAAAFIAHTITNDGDGLAEVLSEAVSLSRSTHLMIAIANLFLELLPELRTPTGQDLVRESIAVLASMETT